MLLQVRRLSVFSSFSFLLLLHLGFSSSCCLCTNLSPSRCLRHSRNFLVDLAACYSLLQTGRRQVVIVASAASFSSPIRPSSILPVASSALFAPSHKTQSSWPTSMMISSILLEEIPAMKARRLRAEAARSQPSLRRRRIQRRQPQRRRSDGPGRMSQKKRVKRECPDQHQPPHQPIQETMISSAWRFAWARLRAWSTIGLQGLFFCYQMTDALYGEQNIRTRDTKLFRVRANGRVRLRRGAHA